MNLRRMDIRRSAIFYNRRLYERGWDETAQGEFCARAHVAHDEVTIQMLMEARNVMDCLYRAGWNDFDQLHTKAPMIVSR